MKIISFSPEFGHPKTSIFHSRGVPGHLSPFWLKACLMALAKNHARLPGWFKNHSKPIVLFQKISTQRGRKEKLFLINTHCVRTSKEGREVNFQIPPWRGRKFLLELPIAGNIFSCERWSGGPGEIPHLHEFFQLSDCARICLQNLEMIFLCYPLANFFCTLFKTFSIVHP